jgi:tetratricopeptide (TPR) repeat protein
LQMARAFASLQANPFDPQAHFMLGQSLEATSPNQALAHLGVALAMQPDQPMVRYLHASLALRLNHWQEVISDLTPFIAEEPDLPIARQWRGIALNQLGRDAEAVVDFSAALSVFTKSMRLYELRAASYERLGMTQESKADRKKALESAASDSRTLNNEAWRMLTGVGKERNPARALELAQRAVALSPEEQTYWNTLGVAQYRTGDFQSAVSTLERSLAQSQGQMDGFDLYFLAMAHQKLGQTQQAKACFDQAGRWLANHQSLPDNLLAELNAFRAEARACLGLQNPPRPSPSLRTER